MKNRQPYLALWKAKGFDKFPSIPVSQIIEYYRKKFYDHLRKNGKTPLKDILLNINPEDVEIVNAAKELFDNAAKNWMLKAAEKMVKAETWDLGRLAVQAINRVINGEDRETVLRDLGRKIFPQTRGGASIFTEDEKRTLKTLYLELQECIKEIRRKLDIPLKQPGVYDLTQDILENINHYFPEIDNLFLQQELSLLIKSSSIPDTDAEIIVQRINKCIPTNITSPRTIQDILIGIPPFFLEQILPNSIAHC